MNVITAKLLILKSHQYMMKIFIILKNNIDDTDDDEPLSFKKIITSLH